MSVRRTIHRDDQHCETDEHGMMRAQTIRVEEYWQTLGADGKPYASGATREDAIFEHLHSNAFLSSERARLARRGRASDVIGEPLRGVRKVMSYQTSSRWEVESDREELDEMAEQLAIAPCPHPEDRKMWSAGWVGRGHPFCGRCAERLPDED